MKYNPVIIGFQLLIVVMVALPIFVLIQAGIIYCLAMLFFEFVIFTLAVGYLLNSILSKP